MKRIATIFGVAVLSLLWVGRSDAATYRIAQARAGQNLAQGELSSLSALASLALNQGDSILLRRGDTFREPLKLDRKGKTGDASKPFFIGAYGTGDPPLLLGTKQLDGWVDNGGGLFSTKVVCGPVTQLFLDGARMQNAKSPDTGWARFAGVESDSVMFLPPELADKDWVGASILVWTCPWSRENRIIVAQNQNRIVLDAKTLNPVKINAPFILFNHRSALNVDGEWVYGNDDSVLFWKASSKRLMDAKELEASVIPIGFEVASANGLTLSGVDFYGHSQVGIRTNGNFVRVVDCRVTNSEGVGISHSGGSSSLQGNNVLTANDAGIVVWGNGNVVEYNKVANIGSLRTLGPNGMGRSPHQGRGIYMNGAQDTAKKNVLDSIGYSGITFLGVNSLVVNNWVEHFCMTADDGGGIYSIGNPLDVAGLGSSGSVVKRNVVRSPILAYAYGIYLDDGSHDIWVDSNVAQNNNYGVFLHNNRNILVRGNFLVGNRNPVGVTHDFLAGIGDMYGNRIDSNLMVAGVGQSVEDAEIVVQQQNTPLANFHWNTKCLDDGVIASCSRENRELWRNLRVASIDSIMSNTLTPDKLTAWPAAILPKAVGSNANAATTQMQLGLPITMSSWGYVSWGPIKVDTAQLMRFSFRAKGSFDSQNLELKLLRMDSAKYVINGLWKTIQLDTGWKSYSFVFKPLTTDSVARLDLLLSADDTLLWMDSVSLRYIPMDKKLVDGYKHVYDSTSKSLFVTGAWKNPDGYQYTVCHSEPYLGCVLFQGKGEVSAALGLRSCKSHVVMRDGRRLKFSGLQQAVDILDASGRYMARVVPDEHGVGYWTPNQSLRTVIVRFSAGEPGQIVVTP